MSRLASAHRGRIFAGIAAGALAGAMLCGALGSGLGPALADPAPLGCTAADLARVSGQVATETATYLSAHPDVNAFFTDLKSTPESSAQQQLQAYMDTHPQVHADLQRIRQPRTDLHQQCQWSAPDLLPE